MMPSLITPRPHGWLILDKPLGLTSTQALGKARKLLGGKKVGHGGTLDPLASGLLPLAFGEATKLIPYVMDGEKEYDFTIRWGQQRSTDDAEGDIVAESPVRPTKEAILAALPAFLGEIEQIPPAFSAIKIDGRRAYDLARAGHDLEMQARRVNIRAFSLVKVEDEDHASFTVSCGKGTYIRSLARDLALKLGTYGHISALRRTKVGPFTIENAFSLEKLADLAHKEAALTALLGISAALDDIPGLTLNANEAQRLRAGQSLLIRPDQLSLMDAPVIMASFQGTPVALVEAYNGSFRVVRGFTFD
ncbi:MAG: tRNA pseudouridine(55) synthase TruB [Proteobacteria bacterium]|nr:tRNA pseudouridine(55) synthase TruB [Alphaproteobacteria bacterium]NCC02940.1 tRNA pseudouridine(55) synthase TruB [Pseudomonadota bacterium]